MQITITPIGYVQSPRKEIEDDDWGEVVLQIVLTDELEAEALFGAPHTELAPFSNQLNFVLTYPGEK